MNARIEGIKREHWIKFTSDMDHDIYGAQRKVWKMLKNRKKPVNEYVQTRRVDIKSWEKYFGELYEAEESKPMGHFITNNNLSHRRRDIRRNEILKNRKAPGPDHITNEMIKYGGIEMIKYFKLLYNRILETSDIPKEWQRSITIPIFKKEQKTRPENYRGMTLLNTTMKLFTRIIKEKLKAQITKREEQQGFRIHN